MKKIIHKAHTGRVGKNFWLLAGFATAAICLAISSGPVMATPLPGELVISNSSITFDDGNYVPGVSGSSTFSGSYSSVAGGVTTAKTFSDLTPPAAPYTIPGAFTDTGDGFGVGINSTISSTTGVNQFFMGVDLGFDVTNTSTAIYNVTLKWDFSNFVDADGTDAFASSVFDLTGDITDFTDLFSDTLNGDFIGGDETPDIPNQTSGDPLSEARAAFFTMTLNPGDTVSLNGAFTLDMGSFEASDQASAIFSSFVSIDSFQAVPEPGTIILFGTGLLGLLGFQRRRKMQSRKDTAA